jgi:hypothetical protein
MRKKFFFNLSIIITIICITLPFFNSCKKSGPASQLIDAFNKSPLTIKIDKDNAKTSVKPSGTNRFLVTFIDTPFTFDSASVKDLPIGNMFKTKKISLSCKEVTFLYGPNEKYLELISAKGFSFSMDSLKTTEKKEKQETTPSLDSNIKLNIDSMSFKNYKISSILTYDGSDIMELLVKITAESQNQEYTVEKPVYEFNTPGDDKKNNSATLEAEKIKFHQREVSPLFLSIYNKKEAPMPNFSNALQQGIALMDLNANVSNLKVSVKENGKELGSGSSVYSTIDYFLKPNESRSAYNFGINWDLKNLKLSVPGNQIIETAFDIHEIGFKFAIDNLSPDFISAYFELTRVAMEMNAADDKDKAQQQQAIMMSGMKIGTEFIKSKPAIKLSLSPLKHALGEMSGEALFQFPNLLGPVGAASVKIPRVNDIMGKLKKENLIPPDSIQGIEQFLKKLFVIDKKGDAVLSFETKQDQPGKYFLNGKSIGPGNTGSTGNTGNKKAEK